MAKWTGLKNQPIGVHRRKLICCGLTCMLRSSLQKLYDRYNELVDRCDLSISQMATDIFYLTQVFFSFLSPTRYLPDSTMRHTVVSVYSSRLPGYARVLCCCCFCFFLLWGPFCSSFQFSVLFFFCSSSSMSRVKCCPFLWMSILEFPFDFI